MQERIFTPLVPTPRGFYSQGVRAGDIVYISGQLPIDHEGNVVGATPGEQTRYTMQHIENIVKAAGGSLANLVQVTVYITDIEHWQEINSVYKELLSELPFPPARAVVPIKELHYGALVEIQAIAFIPQ